MKRQTSFYGKIIVAIIVLIGLGWFTSSLYPVWLWFQNLDFSMTFLTIVISKTVIGLVAALIFLAALGTNFLVARRHLKAWRPGAGEKGGISVEGLPISEKTVNWAVGVFLVIVALMVGNAASAKWTTVLLYFHPKSFGIADPILGRDVGFYVFSLPFYLFVKGWSIGFLVFSGLVALLVYSRGNLLQLEIGTVAADSQNVQPTVKLKIDSFVRKHLSVLGIIIIAFLVWGYWLRAYELMYSTKGPAFGASYTDIHVQLLAYRVLMIILGALAVLLGVNMVRPRKGLVLIGVVVTLGAMVLGSFILPSLVQKIVVKPNELDMEQPYIAYNIENTRRAYLLDKIQERDFEVDNTLTADDIARNQMTIDNIRIWDERPLKETYNQLQSIRLYYNFSAIDVDRYRFDGEYRQVTLSAREISVDQLPLQAKTWVNRHLKFTHGYGLAMNPVNQVTEEGLPNLLIKDLPPVSDDVAVTRPEIYYGEQTNDYVIVKTKTQEFDYPKGDSNVYTTYGGDGGVPIRSLFRRLLFAAAFKDPQILFTRYLAPDSRIMFYRPVHIRVRKIAPFLRFDQDPYLFVAEGRLFWMVDGYTTTAMYPYSTRMRDPSGGGINYIRNSVKAVVNAYSGATDFYVIDETDPIIQSFKEIFPDLFRPIDEMPEAIQSHMRYPRDFFEIQAAMYRSYHMQDVQVFYNQEDLWQLPNELYADTRQEMEPYYIIIRLPGEEHEEFLQMLPFTPSKKDNMIAWLAARSDMPSYGDLLVYKLPKEKLIYGPMQVEARVDQQTEISRELTLWGQKGSRVIRGNLMAIPIERSFLYVEPVYLQARQESESEQARPGTPSGPLTQRSVQPALSTSLPELKQVIVAYGNELVMRENLSKALSTIFHKASVSASEEISVKGKVERRSILDLADSALEQYRAAQRSLKAGDWQGYGQGLERMESILQELLERADERDAP
jgi:hypothetical protein